MSTSRPILSRSHGLSKAADAARSANAGKNERSPRLSRPRKNILFFGWRDGKGDSRWEGFGETGEN